MARSGAPRSGWYRDPTRRHDLRRWDGDGWSEWVMDGGRRSFDDLDGCGGPPQGQPVAVPDGPRRPRRPGAAARGVVGRPSRSAGASSPLLPGDDAAARSLVPAVVGVAVAAALGTLVVALGERGLLPAIGPGGGEDLVRRFLLPIVLASAASAGALAVTGAALRRRSGAVAGPWRSVRSFGREEWIRGLVAFLLALFARSFLTSALAGPFAGAVRPIGPWWLLGLEAVLLVAVVPVVEEVVYRGAILGGLRHRARPAVAVLGQATIYGAASAWAGVGTSRVAAAIGAFAVGAVLGWFTHVTADLRPAIVGHAMLNGWLVLERILTW